MNKTIKSILLLSIWACIFGACENELSIGAPGNLVPKTVDQDSSLPAITVNGIRLHSEAFGHPDSTLIICIHGGPGADYRYMLNCKSLAEKGYRVVFYDQKGSGLSQRLPKQWYDAVGESPLDKFFYDELRGVISHYKTHPGQKVVLLGQSWGAMLATAYTGKYPNEIYGLISAEPGGLKWDDVVEYVSNSRSFGLWSETLNDVTFLDQFISGKENQHEILDYKLTLQGSQNAITGDYRSELGENTPPKATSRNGAVINLVSFKSGMDLEPDLSEGISQFQKKVLFIYSSNNKAYPDSWADRISEAYTLKETLKVQGVGHSGMIDQIGTWENVTEPKVIDYLNSLK